MTVRHILVKADDTPVSKNYYGDIAISFINRHLPKDHLVTAEMTGNAVFKHIYDHCETDEDIDLILNTIITPIEEDVVFRKLIIFSTTTAAAIICWISFDYWVALKSDKLPFIESFLTLLSKLGGGP